jgi:hypothetical protein
MIGLTVFLALAAAPPLEGSFLRAEDRTIATIGYRIASRASRFCPEPYPLTGLLFHHLPEYRLADRAALVQRYGLDRGPGILAVIDGSPAAQAGLAAGDVLLSVNGKPFPSPLQIAAEPERKRWRKSVEATEALLEEQLRLGRVELIVLRDGRELEIELVPISGCPARVRLARSSQVNAFATGRYVVMTTGLLGFTSDEDELAIALAHELAHNILKHADRLEAQKVPTGFLRGFGKNASRIRATEEEADRLGIKLAWAAGYDVSAAIPFWRRFYAKYDSPQLFRTHPGLGARERLIADAISELPAAAPGSDAEAAIPSRRP